MLKYKAAIFDLDGTLIDSMQIWKKIDVDFLAKRNISVPDDYMESIAHMCAYDTAIYTIERFKLKDKPEDLINEWIEMALKEYSGVKMKPGANEYLEFLKENGKKIAIATATESEIVSAALCNKPFREDIDTIVTVSEVARGKGFPDIYLKCAENLNLSPDECIVFEDILPGVKSAKAGGFYTVGVYEKCSEQNIEEIKEVCDKFIFDFTEMLI